MDENQSLQPFRTDLLTHMSDTEVRKQNIQWFPGHMAKAFRQMKQDLKLVNLVIELRDARAPYATENPDIGKLLNGRKRLILLNKADLADPLITEEWIRFLQKGGSEAVALDARTGNSLQAVRKSISVLAAEKRERDRSKGILQTRALRALVCGIPNVGKSSLINSMTGKSLTRTGNKPGVTKGNQWIHVDDTLMLLDTPGVLWPRFDDEITKRDLALISAINDDLLNKEDLAMRFIAFLSEQYPAVFETRYQIGETEISERKDSMDVQVLGCDERSLAILDLIAMKRNCLKKGGQADYERAAKLLIDDFRSGRAGRISLERPR